MTDAQAVILHHLAAQPDAVDAFELLGATRFEPGRFSVALLALRRDGRLRIRHGRVSLAPREP